MVTMEIGPPGGHKTRGAVARAGEKDTSILPRGRSGRPQFGTGRPAE